MKIKVISKVTPPVVEDKRGDLFTQKSTGEHYILALVGYKKFALIGLDDGLGEGNRWTMDPQDSELEAFGGSRKEFVKVEKGTVLEITV